MKKLVLPAGLLAIAAVAVGATVGCGSYTAAESSAEARETTAANATEPQQTQKTGAGMAAMDKAAVAKKYLFALFWKEEDDQTAAMRDVLQEVMKKVSDRADSVEVNVTAASEEAIVSKFGLDRAPMPLILAIAPNGAVTGGFPTKVEERDLLEAFASPCTEKCMKQLQENKLVFLCIQHATTEAKDAAMEGVHQFQADARFTQATEIVMLDPTDPAEAGFLKDLQIDPKAKAAVTVFLAPPGAPIAKYEGATDKDELVATLQKASSACGPGGCGPGGCPPRE